MTAQRFENKDKVPFVLIFLTLLLTLFDIVLVIAVLNPDLLWKNRYFPFNPVGGNTFSYGISQQLEMQVVEIQDFADHDGSKGKLFVLKITPENGEEKTLDKYVLTPSGSLDEYYERLLYWNPANSSWVTYSERPEEIPAEISIGDMVTVNYSNYYENGDFDVSVKIQTVEHRETFSPEITDDE